MSTLLACIRRNDNLLGPFVHICYSSVHGTMSVVTHLARLQARIETVAETNSRPGKAGLGLEDTLAALDRVGRRRVTMMLELIKAFSNDADEQAAAEHIWLRAARAWRGSTASIARDAEHRALLELQGRS